MQSSANFANASVLVFDRHPLIAASLEDVLREIGAASTSVAADVAAAAAFADATPPALAVLEWVPASDDLPALVERLRMLKVPVVLLAALARRDISNHSGGWAVMVEKPCTDATLQQAIRTAMARRDEGMATSNACKPN